MNLIVAADRRWAIGKRGGLLYHVPEDMKYFRRMTAGKTVVMGQKTFESLPGMKPLRDRTNIVLSSDPGFTAEGCVTVHTLDDMFAAVAGLPEDEVMLIGGGSLYNLLYGRCRRAYITRIDAETPDADTFIPDFSSLPGWSLESESAPVETGGYNVTFAVYLNGNI